MGRHPEDIYRSNGSAVITERTLVEGHGSFWRTQAPSLARLVRSLNAAGREPLFPPITSKSVPERIYLINEVAFELAMARLAGSPVSIQQAFEIALSEVGTLEGALTAESALSVLEEIEAADIASRLIAAIPEEIMGVGGFERRPILRGVGALADCQADLKFGSTLVEIKSGDRKLRSIDIKQIITYFVLSYLKSSTVFRRCIIVNPRQGFRVIFDFDDLIEVVSGMTTVEFVGNFSSYLVDWAVTD